MPVILAKSAGFCYGVERAVKLAEQTAREKGGCVMLGSIIHNAHVVRELEALGARQADDVPQIQPGETVIIRSHGERKQVYEATDGYRRGHRGRHLSQRAAHPAAGGPGRGGGAHPPRHRRAAPSGGYRRGQLGGGFRHRGRAAGAGKMAC